jgi:Fic family protein
MNKIETLYKEWQSLQPLKEQDQNRLDQKFMLEFNYNSNHIEGNMLTYGQTELLLLFGRVVGEAKMKDLEEMKASNVGLKMVKEMALDKEQSLSEYFIRTLHKTLLREDYTEYRQLPDGTNFSYVVHAGQYKTRPNSVITPTGERFEYASPEETPALMTDLLQWYNQAEAEGTMSPIELASLFHYRYIRIHPFEDGNGRISRLIVNYILYRHGYPMIVVRTKDKKNYLAALSKCDAVVGKIPSDGAQASLEQTKPFVDYMTGVLCKDISTNIAIIKDKDRSIWWYNGELITFKSQNTINLLDALNKDGKITVRDLADKLGINKSAVQKQLKTLQDKGYIIRVGGRSGYWKVIIVCTTPDSGTK